MWKKQKIGLILPTYNEKDSIRKCIEDFEALGIIDEIIVVNNNAADGTTEEVSKTSAVEVFENEQGYGAAIQRGFRETKSDLIFVCEPDGTFDAQDVYKFLAYVDELDAVYGSRTVRYFVWQGSNMGPFIRIGNWAVAKLMQVLYNTNSLSDVGCTFRVIRADALKKIQKHFQIKSSFFGPEMMLLTRHFKLSFIQIPVNYKPRVGTSSVTGSFKKTVIVGLQMIWLIFTFRLRRLPSPKHKKG